MADIDISKIRSFVDGLREIGMNTALLGVIAIADRTGLFKGMAGRGPLTEEQITERTELCADHLHDALSALAAAGILVFHPSQETFELPLEHAACLSDERSPFFAGGLFSFLLSLLEAVPQIALSFETGTGVEQSRYSEDLVTGFDRMNSPTFRTLLFQLWLPAMENNIVERLERGANVVDLGCGTGCAALVLAQAFPRARVLGIDLDSRSIAKAKLAALEEGTENVAYQVTEATALPTDPVDLITAFGVLHNLPDPALVLRRAKRALEERAGSLLIMQPATAESLEHNLTERGAMLYALSTLYTIPTRLAQGEPTSVSGAFGADFTESLCREGGFTRFRQLEVGHPLNVLFEAR